MVTFVLPGYVQDTADASQVECVEPSLLPGICCPCLAAIQQCAGNLSEQDITPAEKYLVRVWSGAWSTTTAETFNQLRVEQHTSSSAGTDALPSTSSEIRGQIHGGAFRGNTACRLNVTYHEHSVAMVSYILLQQCAEVLFPSMFHWFLVLHRASEDCL